MNNLQIKRAIISVFDKTGIVELAKKLDENNVEIFSTGGTYRNLEEAGVRVSKISNLTEFPEIMNGRVKTLHPKVFAGLLADKGNPKHLADLESVSVTPFDLVCVNLYAFSEAYNNADSTEEQIIEMIDIGGPSMLRASAKNFSSVAVLSNAGQYAEFMEKMDKDELDVPYLKTLAGDVFVHTAQYDSAIATFFTESKDGNLDKYLFNNYEKLEDLRYGENPDQKAAIYKPIGEENWQPFKQLHGKQISYNNYLDCIGAYNIVKDMQSDEPLVANIKHTNPCGVGIGATAKEAYVRAVAVDPTSYFGGIVCSNRKLEADLATELKKSFLECIIAPEYSDEALEILSKKKNLRLLIPNDDVLESQLMMKEYGSGLLVQEKQKTEFNLADCKVVTESKPDDKLAKALNLGWNIVRNVKSNAIVLADDTGAIGVGAGQMSRVDAMKIAIRKAKEAGLNIENTIIASDAFFPFRDSIDVAAEYKIAGAIQPGGSMRDEEVIEACNEHKMFMLFTGQRVFKH